MWQESLVIKVCGAKFLNDFVITSQINDHHANILH